MSGVLDKYETVGERMLGRELEKEMRAGVPHYKPGQMNARMMADEEVLFVGLSWVNRMGHAMFMPVFLDPKEDKWCTMGVYREAGQQVLKPPVKLPSDYEIPEKTLQFLEEAKESWQPSES